MPSPDLRERLTFLLQASVPADERDTFMASCAERWTIAIEDVDFLLYAIGSYHLKEAVLSGTQVQYDRSFQEVFRELDKIYGKQPPNLWHRIRNALFRP